MYFTLSRVKFVHYYPCKQYQLHNITIQFILHVISVKSEFCPKTCKVKCIIIKDYYKLRPKIRTTIKPKQSSI